MLADSTSSQSDRSRYPGTRPFRDTAEDQALFFGRDAEGEQLYLRVLSVPLLLQFGRSGLGKTSLMQASLFPRLRQKAFLPVMVRFNVTSDSPLQAVARGIAEASRTEGVDLTLGRSGSLRELIATTAAWRDDLLLTLVLVFDQFEEVFTLRDAAFRKELAAELAAFLSEGRPERQETDEAIRSKGVVPHVEAKVVISLREDFLGALEEFSSAIPGLFHERLRLEPLGDQAAREAITCPAQLTRADGTDPFSVSSFEFEPAALVAMIEYLKGKSGVIEPFQLQLLCRHAEAVAARKAGTSGESVRLTLDDIEGKAGFDAVLKNFYRNTLLQIDRLERRTAARLCEEGLLDPSGHRLMLEEGQIRRDFHISEQTLAILSRERLLRRERRLDSAFYEISHDRLAESILRAKSFRLPKQMRRVLWSMVIVAPIILVMGIWWGWSTHKHQTKMNNLLGFLLGNFLEDVRDIGRSRMLDQVQSNLNGVGDISHLTALNRGLALRNQGDIQRIHGSVTEAIRLFGEALKAFEAAQDNIQQHREVARTSRRLGDAFAETSDVDDALASYEMETKAWRAVVQDKFSTREDCTSLADSLVSKSDIHATLGDTRHELDDVEEATKIVLSVLFSYSAQDNCGRAVEAPEAYPDAKALEVLSRIAIVRADVLNYQEDYEATAPLAAEARRLNPTSVETREHFLVTLAWRGNGRTGARALADYRTVLAGFDELRLWDPNNRIWQRQRAANQLLIGAGIVACNSGKKGACNPSPSLAEAEAFDWDAIATFRNLISSDESNISWQADLAWALESQAAVMAAAKRNDKRLELLGQAVDLMGRVVARNERDGDSMGKYGRMLYEKADALKDLNRPAEAKEFVEKSVKVFTRLMTDHPEDPGYMFYLSAARTSEAGVLQKAADAKGAAAAEATAGELKTRAEDLVGKYGTLAPKSSAYFDGECTKHVNAGAKLFHDRNYQAALGEFNAAEAAGKASLSLRPTTSDGYGQLRNVYQWIGNTEKELHQEKEQTAPLNAALRAAQIEALLSSTEGHEAANKALIGAWQDLGLFLYYGNHPEEALPIVQEQVAAAELLLQANTHNASYHYGLGNARSALGMVRRESRKDGWEEAISLGINEVIMANQLDPKNPNYLDDAAMWQEYLGRQYETEGRKKDASFQYNLARQSYRSVLGRFPSDQRAKEGLASLNQLHAH